MITPRRDNFFDILSFPRGVSEQAIVLHIDERLVSVHSDILQQPRVAWLGSKALGRVVADIPEYAAHAQRFGGQLDTTMLITEEGRDTSEALAAGMGVSVVQSPQDLRTIFDTLRCPPHATTHNLYERPPYTDLDYSDLAGLLFKPGETQIVGLVGHTGAGKSTALGKLVAAIEAQGGYAGKLEVDGFFKHSRSERRAWLTEPDISEDERQRRQQVITWWDLDRAVQTIEQVRGGKAVHLEGLYDMQQGGEMVGRLDLTPGPAGYTVFVEGTALLVPGLSRVIDSFIYMNTHDHIRTKMLMERNTRDGYTPEQSRERKALTDAAEINGHMAHALRIAQFNTGKLTVLDNSRRAANLRLMPPFIPQK